MDNINLDSQDLLSIYSSLLISLGVLQDELEEETDPIEISKLKDMIKRLSKTFNKINIYCISNNIEID